MFSLRGKFGLHLKFEFSPVETSEIAMSFVVNGIAIYTKESSNNTPIDGERVEAIPHI